MPTRNDALRSAILARGFKLNGEWADQAGIDAHEVRRYLSGELDPVTFDGLPELSAIMLCDFLKCEFADIFGENKVRKFFVNENAESPEVAVIRLEVAEKIARALAWLPSRSAYVVKSVHGVGESKWEVPFKDLAETLSMSPGSVRKIYNDAMRAIKFASTYAEKSELREIAEACDLCTTKIGETVNVAVSGRENHRRQVFNAPPLNRRATMKYRARWMPVCVQAPRNLSVGDA